MSFIQSKGTNRWFVWLAFNAPHAPRHKPPVNPFKRFLLPLAWIVPPIAGVMAVPFMLFGEPYRREWGVTTAIIALHWVIICYLFWLLWEPRRSSYSSPKVIRLNTAELVVVVADAEWLGQGVGVTLFENTEGYERLLSLGEVFNVQLDGLVQIRLFPFPDDADGSQLNDRLASIVSRDVGAIVVKPGPLRIVQ